MVVVVVDIAASSTFPLYGWSSVSTLDIFQKSRNRKHQCSGWSFNEGGTMIHILWQATGSVLSYQSVKLVYCNLKVCGCLAVSQCVIPEHHSPLKIIPDWARKFYLSETGLIGSNSLLDRTKRTAFPCIVRHCQIRAAFHFQTFWPSAEKISEHTELQASSIFCFFLLSTEYYSRSSTSRQLNPFACPVRDSAQHTVSKIRPWLGPVLDYQLLNMIVIHR